MATKDKKCRCAWPTDEVRKKYDLTIEEYEGCPHGEDGEVYPSKKDGLRYCLFHLPLDDKRDQPELAKEFQERFVEQIKKIVPLRDFRGFQFPDGFDLEGHDFRTLTDTEERLPNEQSRVGYLNFALTRFGNGVVFLGCKLGDSAFFVRATFGHAANLGWARFGPGADFRKATFGDKARFPMATFGYSSDFEGSKFGNLAMFERAVFGDKANFSWCRIGQGASFVNSVFGRGSNFTGSRFDDSANFYRAEFGDSAVFFGVRFGDSASFMGVRFGDLTDFAEAQFGDRARFSATRFCDRARFNNAIFRGVSWFNGLGGFERTNLENVLAKAVQDSLADEDQPEPDRQVTGNLVRPAPPDLIFVGTTFDGPAIFHDVNLSRTLFQQVDLTWVSFLYSQINQTRFVGCNWGRDRTKVLGLVPVSQPRFLFDERLTRSVIKGRPVHASHWRSFFALNDDEWDKIHDDMENGILINFRRIDSRLHVRRKWSYDLKEDFQMDLARVRPNDVQSVALQLKQSLENTREPIAAGDFHFANMEMKRLQAQQEKRKARAWLLWWYKFLNGYGERFGRTFILLTLLVLAFTGIYWILSLVEFGGIVYAGQHNGIESCWLKQLGNSFVYTLQNVLPFKFPSTSLKPGNGFISFISIIQTIFGTSLFTLFILALRSRFRR